MRKLTYAQKIELYEKRQAKASIQELADFYSIRKESVKYLVRLIDYHGYGVLRDKCYRHYSVEEKERAICEVLKDHKSVGETAIKYGLPSKTTLTKWIKNYQLNENSVQEKKRGRPRKK